MVSQAVAEILALAEKLSPQEQQELLSYVTGLVVNTATSAERPDWRDAEGIAPYPLFGEDAQEWVTRTRREGDEARQQQLPPQYRS